MDAQRLLPDGQFRRGISGHLPIDLLVDAKKALAYPEYSDDVICRGGLALLQTTLFDLEHNRSASVGTPLNSFLQM
jgi:hypothetical protein